MSAEIIRQLVERCYSGGMGEVLSPSSLDGLNPYTPVTSSTSAGPVAPQQTPSEIIQSLVGRCYSAPVPLESNPLDSQFPMVPFVPPDSDPVPTPSEVIQQLVGRCYPDLPPLAPPPDTIPPPMTSTWDWGDPLKEIKIWFPDLPIDDGKIIIDPPTPDDPTWNIRWGGGGDDCIEVVKLKKQNLLKKLEDGYWEHINTGVVYFCKDDGGDADEFDRCVRNALECMFRPYFGGQWKPPKADCDAYWPNGWSGNKDEVCIKNCFPDRVAIYETRLGEANPLNVNFDVSGNLIATGSGDAVLQIRLEWNDNPNTYGQAVNNIQFGGKTWTQSGRSGSVTHTLVFSGAGTNSVTYNGITGGFTVVDNGKRLCMKDNHGSDCNANFIIASEQTGSDHAYQLTSIPSPGYALTNQAPHFYALKDPIPGVTKPLFKYYSSSKIDTFLTTNPGQPDSEGAGERVTMNATGMQFVEVLGHVFPTASSMTSYLAAGEQAEALHRFHSSNPFDHRYTIEGDYEGGGPKQIKNKWVYRIPKNVSADLSIIMDVEKGSAGFDNAVGFYLADETGPKYGRVVVTSARGGTNMYTANVPNAKLKQYAGGTMGYFLIPDGGGQNTLTINQEVAFNPLSDGFSAIGISTAQSNYCMFGDNLWNPNDKDHTKWHGKAHQMWEDLLNGDDDYDDLRLWHQVRWSYNGYAYEGIQCYLYADAAPPKVMRKINNDTKCDTRVLTSSFKDVIMRRLDCGERLPTFTSNDIDWECDSCNGPYSVRVHDNQTIKVAAGGKVRVISMGGITGGLFGDCIKFTIKMKKNGVDLFTKQFEAKYWPLIGQDLYDQDIDLATGDTLTFQVVSIDHGPVYGDIALEMGFFDLTNENYDGVFKLTLGTTSDDAVHGETQGNPTHNQVNTSTVGFVRGLAMQFRPSNKLEFEWEAGAKYTESWVEDDTPDPGYPWVEVWSGGGPVAMHGSLQANPDIPGNSRIINNPYMPNLPGAYCDTGYLYDKNEYFSGTILESYKYRNNTGVYNFLVENFLCTRFETLSGTSISASDRATLLTAGPTTFAKNSVPWYTMGENKTAGYGAVVNSIWDGRAQAPQRDTYFSPVTFIHDYTLDNYHGTGGSNYQDACKIRIGITFYPVLAELQTGARTVHYWQAMIHIIDVVEEGSGYTTASEFVLTWPPTRDPLTEDTTQSPYFPDYEPSFQLPSRPIVSWFEDDELVRRTAKEAFYMESHNKDSMVWYSGTDKTKFRVKFKVIITEVTS